MAWHGYNYDYSNQFTSIKLDGVEVRGFVDVSSLSLKRSLDTADASFSLFYFKWDNDANDYATLPILPKAGMEVHIESAELGRIFGGYIASISEESEQIGDGSAIGDIQVSYSISLVDYAVLARRELISVSYEGLRVEQIFEEVVLNSQMVADGVWFAYLTYVPEPLPYVGYSLVYPATIFDDLCNMTGTQWYINPYKELVFVGRNELPASIGVGSSGEGRSYKRMTVERNDDQYMNGQIIRAGNKDTEIRREVFKGNDVDNNFALSFPVSKMLEIREVNDGAAWETGVVKTIGLKQQDETKEYYYLQRDNVIEGNQDNAPLASTKNLIVEYVGSFPLVVRTQDLTAVSDRADIDNTTGQVWGYREEIEIDDTSMLLQMSQNLLSRYGRPTLRVSVEVDAVDPDFWSSLQPGQTMEVNAPHHQINNQRMLIEDVSLSYEDDETPRTLTVQLIDWLGHGDWTDFFKELYLANRGGNTRDNEILLFYTPQSDTVIVDDDLTITSPSSIGPWLVDIALVDKSEVI